MILSSASHQSPSTLGNWTQIAKDLGIKISARTREIGLLSQNDLIFQGGRPWPLNAFMKMGHFQLASRAGLWGKPMDEIGIGLVVREPGRLVKSILVITLGLPELI